MISNLEDLPTIQQTAKYQVCREKMFKFNGKTYDGRDAKRNWEAVDVETRQNYMRDIFGLLWQ